MTIGFVGGRYKTFSGHSRGFGGVSQGYYLPPSLGDIEDIYREALVERLVARRRAPGEDSDASGCAGAPAQFTKPPSVRTVVRVSWPDDNQPDDPDDGQPISDTYTAVWWELETVRVENPSDSEQYVNTTRIKQIRYSRPDGTQVTLDNRPAFAAFPAS